MRCSGFDAAVFSNSSALDGFHGLRHILLSGVVVGASIIFAFQKDMEFHFSFLYIRSVFPLALLTILFFS